MSGSSTKSSSNGREKALSSVEQQEKINEVKKSLSLERLPDNLFVYCSDASIARHLRARNWHVKKTIKMMKETLKWRYQYKPEEIRWEEIAHEAETGKTYRMNHLDKYGRTVLVMRPARENTKSTKGQIRYLVYCMENAILNLPAEQEQMVWLIDFQGYNMSHISVKVTKEAADVLQGQYPERLGVAILYNPPKIFESFWTLVKPFLEPKTYRKVKFCYSDDANSKKIMEDLFDMDKLETSFGGNAQVDFNLNEYAARMKEDDKCMPLFWARKTTAMDPGAMSAIVKNFDLVITESDSEGGKEKADDSSLHGSDSEPESSLPEENPNGKEVGDIHAGDRTVNVDQSLNKTE